MEIDPTIVVTLFGTFVGVSATFTVYILNWARSLEKKGADECERRLSRLEAIVRIYVLDVPQKNKKPTMDYLEEADEEVFGKNVVFKDVEEYTTVRSRSVRKKNGNTRR
jgi:hypothetical protein